MSEKKRILIQLDADKHPSLFDSVVAIDSDVDFLQSFSNVDIADVQAIVHGSIFTRGPEDLKSTAIFIGGNDVEYSEKILAEIKQTFFGPMRVSVMLDSSGANTTAVAAVLSVEKHFSINGKKVAVLGGTGAVGSRICDLVASAGAEVKVVSRSNERAQQTCDIISARNEQAKLEPIGLNGTTIDELLSQSEGLFAAGAAGIELVTEQQLIDNSNLEFAVDLNAVPPSGIESIEPFDLNTPRNNVSCFGAIGVGGLKMKIHKRCIRQLFESNNQVLDLREIYNTGRDLI